MRHNIEYWIERSDYDLDTANDMLLAGRYIYVGFMCHQSIEKIIKAYWCHYYENIPLKIHNLSKLSARANLNAKFSPGQIEFINNLDPMNIDSRYPPENGMLSTPPDKQSSAWLLEQTHRLQTYIKTLAITQGINRYSKKEPLRIHYPYGNYVRTISNILPFNINDSRYVVQFFTSHLFTEKL